MSSSSWNEIIDKPTFLGSLFLLMAVTLPLVIFPETGAAWVATAKAFVTDKPHKEAGAGPQPPIQAVTSAVRLSSR